MVGLNITIPEKYKSLEPFLISLLFVLAYYITFNGNPDYDPIRNLIVSQEVQERGIPTYFDSAYWQHPPLLNYMIAFTSSLFGMHIYLAGKAVILLFSFLSIFVFYELCAAMKDRTFARMATAVFGATPLIWLNSNQIMHEIPQTFFFISTIYFFYLAVKYSKNKYFYFSGIFLGLALLTKSQTVIVIPVILAYILTEKGTGILKEKALVKSVLIMFLISGVIYAPYYLYRAENNAPSLFEERALKEQLTGKADWAPTGDISIPFHFYVTHIFEIISFSAIFFAVGLMQIYKKKDKTMWLPVLWVVFSYLILSIFSLKLNRYMIIAVPAMAIITTYGLYELETYFKNRKYVYATAAILVIVLAAQSVQLTTGSGIYWPMDWKMWAELKSLNNSVISTDLNKYSTVRMSYGIVKIMTGKYSDILPEDPQQGVSFAMMYNTPYLLYDGKPELSYPYTKIKYFEECNCTLYGVDENLLFENSTLIKTTSGGKILEGVGLYLLDSNGNVAYRSRSNVNGEIYIPAKNYTGAVALSKICYESIQTYIKIENGQLNLCDLKQRQGPIGLAENYLECKQKQDIELQSRGCFGNKYPMSRF